MIAGVDAAKNVLETVIAQTESAKPAINIKIQLGLGDVCKITQPYTYTQGNRL